MVGQVRAIVQVIGQRGQMVNIRHAGLGVLSFLTIIKEWQSLTFKDIRNKSDAERGKSKTG
ncbi:MAG: hypothetical protein DWB56_13945 [Candidatus Jettenia sp.]|nr:MAG: hypothetical protein EDM77_12805 [Candidatus Jettenia sp. AMX1]MBC6930037.1 hypothetical protein [Candidatus Jettenia sp.]WKZ16606.1 MAG: hypothetical protein QY317_04700 [Candidatus Jettenia caeni]MCE7881693.1 hypothetical protein [Candidatus Jettenia sp. AMX1]MCQ3928325.1 hypothetical protein [Candidatus Jettenia sp.]